MLQKNLIYLFNKEAYNKKISITKVCENMGISKQNYQRYKNGSEPTATFFYKISKYFNIPMEDLILKDLEKENNL